MADRFDVGEGVEDTAVLVDERVQDDLHADLVVSDRKVAHHFFLSGGFVLKLSGLETDFFDDSLRFQVEYVVALHVQKLVFDGRASAIDNKNDHSDSVLNV